jgi:serine protease
VAAGNDATDASQVLPASCNGVITVAASDARGQLVERYSNYGSTVEIMAPGGDVNRDDDRDGNPDGVLSTVQGGYAYYNGTSMATPHVAGVAALWLAQVPSLTAAQLAADLQRFALPRTAAQCPDPCGAGLLNADRAGPLVTVTLNPDKSPYQRGETIVATATVTRGGVPQAGRAVSFVSANSSVLSVAQPSATTDAGGVATTTLTAASNGETRLTVSADGREWSTPVDVPDLSALGLAALVAAMAGSVVRRRRTSVGDR